MPRRKSHRARPLALAYIRVSTVDQAEHGASLDAQRSALEKEAVIRGWDVEVIADEGISGKTIAKRPGLVGALERLDAGEADYLLAVRLDRISRSVADFASLLDRATKRGWQLRLLDPNIDTSEASGIFTANVLASAAQYERDLISKRTKETMAAKKAEGVRFGRPRLVPDEVVERIHAMRAEGASMQRIADTLNDEGVPTAHGGRQWHASTIWRALNPASPPGTPVSR